MDYKLTGISDLDDLLKPIIMAYELGEFAAKHFSTLQDCPYDAFTLERKAWMAGYMNYRQKEEK